MAEGFQKFLRPFKTPLKKLGMPPPKYMRNGSRQEGSVHHHLVMQETDLKLLRGVLATGRNPCRPALHRWKLPEDCEYFVKYAKGRWRQKKRRRKKALVSVTGIKKPTIGKPKMIKSGSWGQIRIPKGYYLDRDSVRWGISAATGTRPFAIRWSCCPIQPEAEERGKHHGKVARRSTGTRRSTCT